MIPVKGDKALFRDPHSKAIVTNDLKAYERFKKRQVGQVMNRKMLEEFDERLSRIETAVERLIDKFKDY